MTVRAPLAEIGGQLALAAIAALCAAAAAAQPAGARTAQQWLEAMDAAFREVDYDGVFSYYTVNRAQQVSFSRAESAADDAQTDAEALAEAGRATPFGRGSGTSGERRMLGFGVGYRTQTRLAMFRIVHKVVGGIGRERIVHLNGPPREILRVGDEVTYVLQSGDQLLTLDGAAPASPYNRVFGRRFENTGDVYQVRANGRHRVAGRSAVRLSVTPRHQDRFGYRLWVDEETGLLLRSELKDAEGADLEIFQFASLRTGDEVADDALRPATEGAVVRRFSEPAAATAAAAPHWQARWVPPGFRLASAALRQPAGRTGSLSTLVFSDGLAAFSVFIEDMPEAGAGTVVTRNGGTVVLTHSTTAADGEHLVTVVGEVPVATARRIAAGVFQARR